MVHDELLVRTADGELQRVAWRLVGGALHVDRGHYAVGAGRGRAWRDGAWSQRHRRTEALAGVVGGRMADDEDDLDD